MSITARPHANIVGSGPNGLTAAAMLARAGWHVRIYERNDIVGVPLPRPMSSVMARLLTLAPQPTRSVSPHRCFAI